MKNAVNARKEMSKVVSKNSEYKNRFEELLVHTKKELLEIAKGLKISGRHDMTKGALIEQIIKIESEEKEQTTMLNETTTNVTTNTNTDDEIVANNKYATRISENDNEEPKKTQDDYINNIEIGMIIAFKVSENRAISAKVETIDYEKGNVTKVYCKTRNGIEYEVPRAAIVWVKTGARWPKMIFVMLKGKDYKENYIKENTEEINDKNVTSEDELEIVDYSKEIIDDEEEEEDE